MTDNINEIPVFYDMIYTNDKGNLTPDAYLYSSQLSQVLQQIGYMFNNGITHPSKTTVEITVYRDDDSVAVGTTWFNTSISKLQVKTALGSPGTIETIQSV